MDYYKFRENDIKEYAHLKNKIELISKIISK